MHSREGVAKPDQVKLPLSKSPSAAGILALGFVLSLFPAAPAGSQETAVSELQRTASRTGVFFRADAPYALRNRDDTYLPVYLEIINGVERTGHSAATAVSQYITRPPLKVEGVDVFVKPSGARREFAPQPLPLGRGEEPFVVTGRMRKTFQISQETIDKYLRRHFIGGPFPSLDLRVSFRVEGWPPQDFFLRVRRDAPPLPSLPGWYRGDMHYHCMFTDNAAERGYPLSVTKQAALQADFNWVFLADHSTDLSAERYAEEMREVGKYRDGRFLFIRGEELAVASGKEGLLTTVHMVVAPSPEDPDRGFAQSSGEEVILTGDGSLTSPAMPLGEALARVAAAGGFAYAAHPFDPISPILRGGNWDLDFDFMDREGKGLNPGLVGLEPWNRATTVTADDARDPYCIQRDRDPDTCFHRDAEADQYSRLERGIDLGWRPLLRKALSASSSDADSPAFKVFLAAGSDAHGDLDFEATMDAVDFSRPLRGITGYAEDNALGKISTVVHCPNGMGPRGEEVLRALRDGRSVLSNGPLLIAGFDRDGNGSLGDPADILPGGHVVFNAQSLQPLQLLWVSSEEFGPLVSIRLIVGSAMGEAEPQEIPIPVGKSLASGSLHALDVTAHLEKLGGAWGTLRLEVRTRNGAEEEFRCYTNPLWVRVAER
jgi:hypothetical protein